MPVSAALFMDYKVAGGEDPATTAWANAVIAATGTVSTGRRSLIDTLIKGLKSDGLWTKLERLWITAAENSIQSSWDLIQPTNFSILGSPSFNANQGWQGGPGSYLDTNFVGTTATLYKQNDAHVSVWSCLTGQSAGPMIALDDSTSPSTTNIYGLYSGGVDTYMRLNDVSPAASSPCSSTGAGLFTACRSSSTVRTGYWNSTQVQNVTQTSGAPASGNFLLQFGSATWGNVTTTMPLSAASIGGNLTSTDVTNFYNRLRTFMTAVGVP